MLLAATADSNSFKSAWSQVQQARVLLGETLSATFAGRVSLWMHGALTLYGAIQVWSFGASALASALGGLALAALVATSAFFRPLQSQGALFELARARGLSLQRWRQGLFVARLWLVLRPFVVSVPLLWLSALGADTALGSWLRLPAGILTGWACALGLAFCLTTLAWLSEQWASNRPGRLLFTLILLPAFLKPAVPELPSVWHGYHAWTAWSIAKVSKS